MDVSLFPLQMAILKSGISPLYEMKGQLMQKVNRLQLKIK